MKKLFYLFMATIVAVGFASCSEDNTEDPVKTPTPDPVILIEDEAPVIPAAGATVWVNYTIENPVEGEELACDVAADSWVVVEFVPGSIKFAADKNETGAERSAEVIFTYAEADPVTVTVTQPAWQAPITLTIEAVEAAKVVFSVATTNPELTWIPLLMTKSDFDMIGSEEQLFEDDMAYISWAASEAGVSLSEFLATLLKKGSIQGLAFAGLTPETEYVLYVYGMDLDGVPTTDIYTQTVTTAEPYDGPITFDIKVTEENYIMDITITPSHEGVAYYWNIMDEATYNDWGGVMPDAVTALIEWDIEDYLYWGDISSRSEYFEWFTTINANNSQFECMANTKYIIFASKWNENCELEGEMAYVWHTSATVDPSDNQITLTVSDPTPTSFSVETTTTNNDPYVVLAEPSEWCGWDALTDDEIHAYVMAYYGTWFITDYICQGDITGARFTQLETETDYSVVAYGYEAGARTTDVVRASITTLAGGDPADCTFEFEVLEVGSNYAYVNVAPSDGSHWYYWMVYEASMTADEVKADILNTIDEWYYGDLSEFAYYELVQGQSDGEVTMLTPETEYKIAAVIMDDETGDFLSDVHFSETFSTPEMVYADLDVTCGFDAYYDGDLLAAASDEYAIYAGYALVPLKLQVEGEFGEYYYTMFSYVEGLEDPEIYPDYMLYESLYQGVYYAMEMNFRAPWDEPVMITAVAIDYYGNYSPVYRQVVTFTKEGASPIDELINATRSMVELRGEQIDAFAASKDRVQLKRNAQRGSDRFSSEKIQNLKGEKRQKSMREQLEMRRKARKSGRVEENPAPRYLAR